MYVLTNYLLGLVYVHLLWLYFYVTGSLVWGAKDSRPAPAAPSPGESSLALADLVITTAAGISITGFILFFLGLAGQLNVYALISVLVLQGVLFHFGRRENVLGSSFWGRRLRRLRGAATLPALVIYVLFLVLALPAVLPPTAWDSISYHLAYAVDFANEGEIYVDEFLRFPYYTNNFPLLYSLLFILKLDNLCHFLSWLCGLLSGLGVYALLTARTVTPDRSSKLLRHAASLRGFILTLSVALSPLFLRYLNVSFIDVPIGFFIFVPVLCAYLCIARGERSYEVSLVLTAAFCAGMKVSHAMLLPLFFASLVLVYCRQRRKLSSIWPACLALLILSSPWYLRNAIATGDPISPTLNILYRGADPVFTLSDYRMLMGDFRPATDFRSLAMLPANFFSDPLAKSFREYGTNLLTVLLYLPFAVTPLFLFARFRRLVSWEFIYLHVALIYLFFHWVGISSLGRYFLALLPVHACYVGVCVNGVASYLPTIFRRGRRVRPLSEAAATVLVLFTLIPSPTADRFIKQMIVSENYLELPERLRDRKEYLRRHLPGYASTQLILTHLKTNGLDDRRVLTVGFENLSYYYRRNKILNVGDWFGPGRYADLYASVNNRDLGSYLDRFRIGAVLISLEPGRVPRREYLLLQQQLEEHGFVQCESPEPVTDIYIKKQ